MVTGEFVNSLISDTLDYSNPKLRAKWIAALIWCPLLWPPELGERLRDCLNQCPLPMSEAMPGQSPEDPVACPLAIEE